MAVLDEFLTGVNRDVDKTLDALIPSADAPPVRLHEAVRWSVFAGGKRIRPAILIAVGEAFGADRKLLLHSAAAFEMVHTYSLIHDDLPAMDDDDMRRGMATCHKQFGEATAILAGDVLQTLAFKAIADDASLSAELRIGIISLLATSAGTPAGMVSGQQLDLDAEGETLSIEHIEKIHAQKTGALISAAAIAGAIIGRGGQAEIEAVRSYADNLGLLFQLTDDLLDITQTSEMLGKTAGKDEKAEKATYPAYFGVEKTSEMAVTIRNGARDSLNAIEKNTDLLRGIADMIVDRTH